MTRLLITPQLLLITLLLLIGGCASNPPKQMDDACAIFKEKDDWYRHSWRVFQEFGVPVPVQLAIIHQESRFTHDARPEREWLLGFIPWFRPSTAYGYAQVKDSTWDWYREKTERFGDDRDDYQDAVFFIGWYADQAHKHLGISKSDTYNQYLAYHEGQGGFKAKSYLKKQWLIEVARKVKARSERYTTQLKRCEGSLDQGSWWWPF